MILTSMKIHNPQVLKKPSVKALKTAKNRFHVMNAICPEIYTFKTPHFRVLQFAVFDLYNPPVLGNVPIKAKKIRKPFTKFAYRVSVRYIRNIQGVEKLCVAAW